MIYGDAFRPAPSFTGMLGPIRNPGGQVSLEGAGRSLYGKGGANKAAGLASIGGDFIKGIMEARRKAQEAHEAGMSNFMSPQMPAMQRGQQMPLMQVGRFGAPQQGFQRMFGGRRGY